MKTPTLFEINRPMLEDWKVIYTPTGEELNPTLFDRAWNLATRVKRGLEGHNCNCENCKRGQKAYMIEALGYDNNNINLYVVEKR